MMLAASFWQVIGEVLAWLSIGLVVVGLVLMIRGLRRERRVRLRVLILPLVAVVVSLLLYTWILGLAVIGALSWPLLAFGLGAGAVWSRTTQFEWSDPHVMGRRSPWYLVIWASTFALTQILVLTRSAETASYGLSTVFFSTGLTVGMSLGLILAFASVRGRSDVVGAGEEHADLQQALSRAARRPMPPVADAPESSERPPAREDGSALRTVPTTPSDAPLRRAQEPRGHARCPQCGHPVAGGDAFCTRCGHSVAAGGEVR